MKKLLNETKLGESTTFLGRTDNTFGDEDVRYSFANYRQPPNWSISPTMCLIRDWVKKELNIPINYCLVNLYTNGTDYIDFHDDNDVDLDPKYPIVSFSFGAERSFYLRHNDTKTVYDVRLEHNSLILMKTPCQQVYKHSIPKDPSITTPRINLTFRVVQNRYPRRKRQKYSN
jgi:alkylated DNA repair dioxygenase AlkB